MRQTFSCPHCSASFGDPVWRDNHADACGKMRRLEHRLACERVHEQNQRRKAKPNLRIDEIQIWAEAAAASRKRHGIPDWTNGLLKPWKGEAA